MQRSFNFIHGDFRNWLDVASDEGRNLSIDELTSRIKMGRETWIIQAFQLLRQQGYPVRLSGQLDEFAINILHCDDIHPGSESWRYFMVSVRADRDPAFVSQVEIVQNLSSIWCSKDVFIPHWPQPALAVRDPDRGTRMENIVYMGREENLDAELRSNGFRERLAQLGMRLVVKRDNWSDYREADLVLAIRSGSKLYLAVKPASKLLNAWIAGCPAILGPENGYQELRRSELDFFECSTADQVIACIRTLREQPRRFEEMVTNGLERAKEFSRNLITERWAGILNGIVSERYAKWLVDERPIFLKKAELATALLRRRVWGIQVSQNPRAGWWREALRPIRRASVLPGSLRAFDVVKLNDPRQSRGLIG